MNDRLYRSRDDRVISGVAGGLAEQLGLDPSLVRVAWVILAIVSGGLLALVYVVMMIVVPEEPDGAASWGMPPRPPAPETPDVAAPPATDVGATTPEGATAPDVGAAPTATPTDHPTETVPPPPGWQDQRREARARWRDQRREARAARRERGDGSGGAVLFGILLVLVGAWLLARRYLPAVDFDRLWPVALVVLGIALVVLSIRPGRSSP
ncbi:MAG TPA: PspC domain-containing protein [Candidatus Limnocylindrales bacterium]